jgi:hypothetical protein
MKFSQLTTDKALDVLCEITPYIANIATDDELMAVIGKAVKREGMTRAGVLLLGAEKLTKMVPVLLKTHRDDVYGVVAAVNGKTVDEIREQNFIKTTAQIVEVIKDKELLDFFKSCAEPMKDE